MNTWRTLKKPITSIFQLTFCVIMASLVSLSSWAADGIKVLDPGIKHFNKSYNELTGDWYNWAVQIPPDINPILQDGLVDCRLGQQGKIWFLAGNFGGISNRECTIPSGKALFFPLINTLWWVPEDGDSVAEVRALANANTNAISALEVTIDGVVIEDPFAYRAQSAPGGFALNFGPLLEEDFPATPDPRDPAVADGYWILLAPLHKGEHEIYFRSVVGDPDSPDFELEVFYLLRVGE